MVNRIIVASKEGQGPSYPGSLRLSSGPYHGYWFSYWDGICSRFDTLFSWNGGLHEEEVLEVLSSEGMISWS